MLKTIFLFVICFSMISCNESKQKETKEQVTNNQILTSNKIVSSIGETLNPSSRKLIEGWKEYKILDEFLIDYYSINIDDALVKAEDLKNYTQQLRDSIRIEEFERPDIKIRLNVLYNNSLRLYDMESIPSIKGIEVENEISNILNAFSALNSKINNIVNQQDLEKELKSFENK